MRLGVIRQEMRGVWDTPKFVVGVGVVTGASGVPTELFGVVMGLFGAGKAEPDLQVPSEHFWLAA